MSMVTPTESIDSFDVLPKQLKEHNQWVVWKLHQKPNKPKPDKIPINPLTHEWASVSNKSTWGSFNQAMATFAAFPGEYLGLGFVITTNDPFVFIDLDNVRTADGWNPLVSESLEKIPSWAEFSQSGNGIHILAEATGTTVVSSGIEVYQYGRFVALTGRYIPDTPKEIKPCQAGVDWLRGVASEQGGNEVKQAAPAISDPRMTSFDRIGVDYVFKATGKAEMVCPWGHEHGNGDPSGAVYLPAHYNGRATPNFFCQHATCQSAGRSNISALDGWLAQQDPEYLVTTIADAFASVVEENSPEGSVREPLFANARDLLQESSFTPNWILKGIMERGHVGLMYGDSQSFKSYLCLDIAAHIASNTEWQGHAVHAHGHVLFLAGEGNSGLVGRIGALRQHHGFTEGPLARLHVSSRGLDLMLDGNLLELAEIGRQFGEPPILLVVDTLSRNALLEENNAKDIADLVARCTTVALRWNCAVLIVHHTGKGKEASARGSSALTSNTDFRYKIVRADTPHKTITTLTVEKLKSALEPKNPLIFETAPRPLLGVEDEDGETPTNLAFTRVLEGPIEAAVEKQERLTPAEDEAFSIVAQRITELQGMAVGGQNPGATKNELWEAYAETKRAQEVEIDRKAFLRILSKLVSKGWLEFSDSDGEGVWYFLKGR